MHGWMDRGSCSATGRHRHVTPSPLPSVYLSVCLLQVDEQIQRISLDQAERNRYRGAREAAAATHVQAAARAGAARRARAALRAAEAAVHLQSCVRGNAARGASPSIGRWVEGPGGRGAKGSRGALAQPLVARALHALWKALSRCHVAQPSLRSLTQPSLSEPLPFGAAGPRHRRASAMGAGTRARLTLDGL